jgi:homoserine kinase
MMDIEPMRSMLIPNLKKTKIAAIESGALAFWIL